MIVVFELKIDDVKKDIFTEFINIVPFEKRKRLLRNKSKLSQLESILGDLLVRYALKDVFGINSSLEYMTQNQYGKPSLISGEKVYFNLSHSKGMVVVAIDNMPIGIDVEHLCLENYMELAKEFYTDEEYLQLYENRLVGKKLFYEIWTVRESYLKAIGRGLSVNSKDISVIKDANGICLLHKGKKVNYNFQYYYINEEIVVTIASKNKGYIRKSICLEELDKYGQELVKLFT